ncbi:MAG: abortive infection family protein [Kiritimatiellae bacterium]|nr:abortive infection family protein [Kiritimatiellia bacterium]
MRRIYRNIEYVDQGILAGFFNRSGYVLDFSTAQFDEFTQASVGIPLCSVYGRSKGKSLDHFTRTGKMGDVVKLYDDLISYYEAHYQQEMADDPNKGTQIQRLKIILDKYRTGHADAVVATPAIKGVDYHYIRDMAPRANEDVEKGDFDSALTKARTLLEETFIHVLEKTGVEPEARGDIVKLHNQVKACFGMRQSPSLDKRINGLLSGLEKILSAITEMRNAGSDSHGVGRKRIIIQKHHARLFVNAAQTMADFMLAVGEAKR